MALHKYVILLVPTLVSSLDFLLQQAVAVLFCCLFRLILQFQCTQFLNLLSLQCFHTLLEILLHQRSFAVQLIVFVSFNAQLSSVSICELINSVFVLQFFQAQLMFVVLGQLIHLKSQVIDCSSLVHQSRSIYSHLFDELKRNHPFSQLEVLLASSSIGTKSIFKFGHTETAIHIASVNNISIIRLTHGSDTHTVSGVNIHGST
mmetsp:Transcript_24467/g.33527  ORF Transcript_24467/g.33527 Transcript_24467/m.33527 type:complete len:204 (-) Transcript_24467:1979-2590(-)